MADNYIARKDTQWLIISLVPDVCKTPIGPATPPIPYPVITKLEDASAPVSSVRANGQPVVVFGQSFVLQTLGDEAGTAMGVKSSTVGGKCHPKEHTHTVRADGKLTLRHADKFWMNGS